MLNPNEVLDKLDLKRDMAAAEFGCGSGGFTIPLAKKLEDGIVYAIDIQQAPLVALKSRAAFENIANIKTIHSDLEKSKGSTLADSSVDLVLIPNVLFQIEEKEPVFAEAKRVLKKQGRLVIVDWSSKTPKNLVEGIVLPEAAKKLADSVGLKLEKEFEAGVYHYGLIFERP